MASDPKRVQAVFLQAVELSSADRASVLSRECGDDGELRQRVEALLQAHDEPGSFLERGMVTPRDTGELLSDNPPTSDPPPLEGPGSRIGPYKLLQKLGEGGMGVVYLAEQEQPVRRRVALKIIKAGMDSAPVIARFEQERQALALMDHPHIAKVLDAGATASGRPYFAMELVKGIPITKFCDQEQLTPRERLELLIPVCHAVQHAHQKGIIHRDLKPSNVLIALYDGQPVPKVIDFGVAKATSQRLTERTLFTEVGSLVGTLEYMAPEQAELNNLDIDTRADIYSLGVLLYELLTGSPPFSGKELRAATFEEMLRILREVEPLKPSTKLSSSAELPAIAAKRKLEAKRLTKLVHGDLDWIVMKCLAKERNRRYETANSLALDIEHYLHDEPVRAGPPGTGYQLRKFARKYKKPLAIAIAFVALLLGAVVISTWQAVRAIQAEQAEAAERRRAEDNERQAKTVLGFFQDKILAAGRPEGLEGGLGHNVTLRQAIDVAEPGIAGAFKDQPLTEASIRSVLAKTYYYLSEFGLAIQQSERAKALRQAHLGLEHSDTLDSMHGLAVNYAAAGRFDLAISLLEETLELRKAKLGPAQPDTLNTMDRLARAYEKAGKAELALPLGEEVLQLRKAVLGPEHPDTLDTMTSLAWYYAVTGKTDLAIPICQEVLQLRKAVLGPEHPDTLRSMNTLAGIYDAAGKGEQALPLQQELVKVSKAKMGSEHEYTLLIMNNLALAYENTGQLDLAIPLLDETFKLAKRKLGSEHPGTLLIMGNLARAQDQAGKYADALRLGQEVVRIGRRQLPADHPSLSENLEVLGRCLLHISKPGEAEPLLRECLAIRQQKQPAHWKTFYSRSLLGGALLGQQKYADAEPLLLAGCQGMKEREDRINAGNKRDYFESLEWLVQVYVATDNKVKADEWRKKLAEAKTAAKACEKK